ncbi:MAG TPA: pyridoxal phosphate-dependent aminotransferase [Polyangiaceae bacterium]|nr:pyridoxal phosphate-dependent aminotransferase [Polyangiaceae bacterium]
MFSCRTSHDRTPSPFTQALEVARRAGTPLLDLTLSNPTESAIAYEQTSILRALASPASMRYEPEPFGPRAARELLVQHWAERGFRVLEQQILISASTSESYSLIFKLLCDPGHEVLVPVPSYPLFEQLARFEGVRAVPYELGFDGAWFIDFAELERRVTPASRAIVVVSPNNPTGHYLRRGELARLASFGLPIVSDEVFEAYPIDPPADRALSILEVETVPVFALSGLSKLAALPQMKLAWMTLGGPGAFIDEATRRLEHLADAFLSPSAPVLAALGSLLETRHTAQKQIQARLVENASWLRGAVAGSAVSVLPIEGGWYAMIRLPRIQDDESWALEVLERAQVVVQPGYFYDACDEGLLVLGLLTPPETFRAGVSRILRVVQDHLQIPNP